MNPSSSRADINLTEILTLKQKVLYLAYPLLNFEQPLNQLQYAQTSELSTILEQYFAPLVGNSAQETANLAMKILKVYEKKNQTTNQEALGRAPFGHGEGARAQRVRDGDAGTRPATWRAPAMRGLRKGRAVRSKDCRSGLRIYSAPPGCARHGRLAHPG